VNAGKLSLSRWEIPEEVEQFLPEHAAQVAADIRDDAFLLDFVHGGCGTDSQTAGGYLLTGGFDPIREFQQAETELVPRPICFRFHFLPFFPPCNHMNRTAACSIKVLTFFIHVLH